QNRPPLALLRPQRRTDDLPEVVLGERVAAGRDLDVEEGLLDVRGQEQQVEELRDTGAGEAQVAGQTGAVRDLASVDHRLEAAGGGRRGSGFGGAGGSSVKTLARPRRSRKSLPVSTRWRLAGAVAVRDSAVAWVMGGPPRWRPGAGLGVGASSADLPVRRAA